MADSGRETVEALERRVQSLEAAVRALTDEVARTRAETRAAAAAPAVTPVRFEPPAPVVYETPPPFPASESGTTKSGSWLPPNIDFESLVGRYGTLVLSTISALAAVGLFLSWAIEKGFLGPQQRLGLGLITAAALGVGGMRLRRRERSFGASLLGLSLAITHVCAWGAGPALRLVPSWAAFLFAALASIALAIFAHAENDEPLWCVGFSGAAIAPFVTSEGRGSLPLLAMYGVAVLTSAGYAMNARRWLIAGRLFLLASLLYTAALASGFENDFGALLAMGFPLAVAILGVIPWTKEWIRRERLRALGVLAVLGAVRTGLGTDSPFDARGTAALIAGAGILWLILVDRTQARARVMPETQRYLHEGDWLDAAVLPLGFILASLAALDASAIGSGWFMAGAAGVMLLTVVRSPHGSLRDAAVFATLICAVVALLLLWRSRGSELIASIAALSAISFAANRAWRSASWTTLGLIGLAWVAVASIVLLAARPEYEYAPFATRESAVAASVLVAILAAMRSASDERLATWLKGGALLWAFLWVHQELLFAINPTAAILLRVTYYAATSVAAVGMGRARSIALMRHIGLGLAMLAAGTALYGARNLEAIGARIGADLVAAIFLLAIAYWYRRPGAQRDDTPPLAREPRVT